MAAPKVAVAVIAKLLPTLPRRVHKTKAARYAAGL